MRLFGKNNEPNVEGGDKPEVEIKINTNGPCGWEAEQAAEDAAAEMLRRLGYDVTTGGNDDEGGITVTGTKHK